mmetsp:Transcript_16394/g.50707  ORF Transcript_16394/g.50707 Transcript_16394/m.50707 type:complete len:218 (+) Transcript_16394:979-1632(+)
MVGLELLPLPARERLRGAAHARILAAQPSVGAGGLRKAAHGRPSRHRSDGCVGAPWRCESQNAFWDWPETLVPTRYRQSVTEETKWETRTPLRPCDTAALGPFSLGRGGVGRGLDLGLDDVPERRERLQPGDEAGDQVGAVVRLQGRRVVGLERRLERLHVDVQRLGAVRVRDDLGPKVDARERGRQRRTQRRRDQRPVRDAGAERGARRRLDARDC